jgi:hypothetical protein
MFLQLLKQLTEVARPNRLSILVNFASLTKWTQPSGLPYRQFSSGQDHDMRWELMNDVKFPRGMETQDEPRQKYKITERSLRKVMSGFLVTVNNKNNIRLGSYPFFINAEVKFYREKRATALHFLLYGSSFDERVCIKEDGKLRLDFIELFNDAHLQDICGADKELLEYLRTIKTHHYGYFNLHHSLSVEPVKTQNRDDVAEVKEEEHSESAAGPTKQDSYAARPQQTTCRRLSDHEGSTTSPPANLPSPDTKIHHTSRDRCLPAHLSSGLKS